MKLIPMGANRLELIRAEIARIEIKAGPFRRAIEAAKRSDDVSTQASRLAEIEAPLTGLRRELVALEGGPAARRRNRTAASRSGS